MSLGALSSSWRLGTLLGIPVRVHANFWLLLGWIALSHVLQGHGLGAIASGLLLILAAYMRFTSSDCAATAQHYQDNARIR